jgi:hypothetical protein
MTFEEALRLRAGSLGIKAALPARRGPRQQPKERTARGRWRFSGTPGSRMVHDPQTTFDLIGLGLPCVSRATVRAPTAALRAGEGPWRPLSLFVFGRGLRFALRLFSACNPRRSNLHQYRFVLFRYSLRQTPAFCRVLPEAVSVTVHDTFHLFGCSNVPSCKPGTLRTVPVEMNFADGTKAAIRRSRRALIWGAA